MFDDDELGAQVLRGINVSDGTFRYKLQERGMSTAENREDGPRRRFNDDLGENLLFDIVR